MLHRTIWQFRQIPVESAMYQQINEQFAAASRQFADTAAQVNRLALDNAEQVFGLQMTAIEENVNATFAFWGELANARDFDSLKAVWPKGVQIARENIERTINAGQEVYGRTIKANEQIGQIAKGQFEAATEAATAQVKTVADKVTKAASKK
jgi:hypothetical protein